MAVDTLASETKNANPAPACGIAKTCESAHAAARRSAQNRTPRAASGALTSLQHNLHEDHQREAEHERPGDFHRPALFQRFGNELHHDQVHAAKTSIGRAQMTLGAITDADGNSLGNRVT
jgi:hypothetical protein